ncbi:hypothetical protein AK812_SmicGene21356 [Symbiodinium microadriaticum]|uniref:Uncharacterized protein n=1 Tax=Symbiodinium microadriaticum TaxID=2951 RepID=A0A1Q9DMK8_SYMMI|nr:hypothetical protein AK812_SmicGene21356 [Symbiodinium microadriaticum]
MSCYCARVKGVLMLVLPVSLPAVSLSLLTGMIGQCKLVAPLETEEVAKLAARDALREFSAERVARAPSQIRPCPATLISDRRISKNKLQGVLCQVALEMFAFQVVLERLFVGEVAPPGGAVFCQQQLMFFVSRRADASLEPGLPGLLSMFGCYQCGCLLAGVSLVMHMAPCPHGYSPVDLPLLENYQRSILDSPSCVANLDSECEQTISFAGIAEKKEFATMFCLAVRRSICQMLRFRSMPRGHWQREKAGEGSERVDVAEITRALPDGRVSAAYEYRRVRPQPLRALRKNV